MTAVVPEGATHLRAVVFQRLLELINARPINRQTGTLEETPDVTTRGFVVDARTEALLKEIPSLLAAILEGAGVEERTDPGLIKEKIRVDLQRFFRKRSGLRPLVAEACRVVRLSQLAADAGYDSEANHRFARQECRIRTIIPPKHGRPTTKPARGHYRRLMQTRFDDAAYKERVQVETVVSMVKRRLEGYVRGHGCWSQRRELRLKVLTHNIMILLSIDVFYRATPVPFNSSHAYRTWLDKRSVGLVARLGEPMLGI